MLACVCAVFSLLKFEVLPPCLGRSLRSIDMIFISPLREELVFRAVIFATILRRCVDCRRQHIKPCLISVQCLILCRMTWISLSLYLPHALPLTTASIALSDVDHFRIPPLFSRVQHSRAPDPQHCVGQSRVWRHSSRQPLRLALLAGVHCAPGWCIYLGFGRQPLDCCC
jgi:hypothetical protein